MRFRDPSARLKEERGQSLVIVAVSMLVLLGIAALAIDVSQWYVTRHRAQVAADAVALAGANCMASGGTVTSCTTVASDYVSRNGFSASNIRFNYPANKQITVNVSGTGTGSFSSALKVAAPNIAATSVASWSTVSSPLCTPTAGTNQCYVAFASSPTSTIGVSVSANNTVISGAIHSNCSVVNNGNNNTQLNGSVTYGSGSGCNVQNVPGATQDSSPLCFPIDYSGLTQNPSSCGGSDVTPGVGPSSCTTANTFSGSTTFTASSPGPGLYCLTSGTATISGNFSSGAGGITVIAPAFTLTSAGTLYPYQSSSSPLGAGNQLVMYQYLPAWNGWTTANGGCPGSSNSGTLLLNGNTSFNLNGYLFAPCAYVDYKANNASMLGFIEAYDILFEGASMTGDGPPPGSGTTITANQGSDQLTG